MIIRKLSVKSFGKLKSFDLDLQPGFNIIYGQNESGKSTLQSFIKGTFFGLRKKSKKDELSEYDKYMPWNSDEFAGMIEYEVDGKMYKVARNFITNKVSVHNEFWDDITDQFPVDRKNGTLFAEAHLGMTEDCFERTIFIKQLESKLNDDNKEVIDRLINLQQTGQEDVSYKKAIELLESAIKDKIGSDKTSRKPINMINAEIERLTKEKYVVTLLRNEIFAIEEAIKQKDSERQEILEKIQYYKDIKQSIRRESLLEQYNKAKEYENSIESIENELRRIEPFKEFPVVFEEKIKEILFELRNYNQVLINKKEYLRDIELRLQAVEEENGTGETGDNQTVFTAASDFELMKEAVREKDEYQSKLNVLVDDLDNLNEQAQAFKNMQSLPTGIETQVINYEKQQVDLENRMKELERIKDEIDRLGIYTKGLRASLEAEGGSNGQFSLEDMENLLIKYKALGEYKDKIVTTQKEIEKIEKDIERNDAILYDLEGFANLPKDIEDKVMKLQGKMGQATSSLERELEGLVSRKSVYKYQLITSLLVLLISLGLLGYGVYSIFSSENMGSYIVSAIGGITTIGAVIKLISLLSNMKSADRQLSVIDEELKFKQNKEVENNKDVSEIFSAVGVSDFTQFMKGLYAYRDASHKITMLSLDLGLKRQYLDSIKYQLGGIQQEVSQVLSSFGVAHDVNSIGDMQILMLKERFNKSISSSKGEMSIDYLGNIKDMQTKIINDLRRAANNENAELSEIESIYEKLAEQRENVQLKLSEVYQTLDIEDSAQFIEKIKESIQAQKDIEVKKNEIEGIQGIIYKHIDKVINIDAKIKSVLSVNGVQFNEEALVAEEEIESLKSKFSRLLQSKSELSSLRTIRENIMVEVMKAQESLSSLSKQREEILEGAMVQDEEDFFEGCIKHRKYKELMDEKNRLVNIHEELLKGEDSHTILQKISSMGSKELGGSDVNSVEHVDIEIENLKDGLKRIDEEVINLRNESNNKLKGKAELHEIVEQIESLQEKKAKLEAARGSIEIALDVLKDSSKEIQKDFAPKLQQEISDIISQITGGKYTEVMANEKLNINVMDPEGSNIIDVDKLSLGTVEQFYLSLRIALSNMLGDESAKLPIIIDEAFVQYDDLRIRNVLKFLLGMAKDRQIIIFTCQGRELEVIKSIGLDEEINIIDLCA